MGIEVYLGQLAEACVSSIQIFLDPIEDHGRSGIHTRRQDNAHGDMQHAS